MLKEFWLSYLKEIRLMASEHRQGLSVRFDDTVKYGHGLAKK
jgi:hypothetical protein